MDERCKALWEKLSAALKPQVSADTFKRWFSAVELTKATEDELTFVVPNNIYQFWIESNHMAALQSAITDAVGAPRTVRIRDGGLQCRHVITFDPELVNVVGNDEGQFVLGGLR